MDEKTIHHLYAQVQNECPLSGDSRVKASQKVDTSSLKYKHNFALDLPDQQQLLHCIIGLIE